MSCHIQRYETQKDKESISINFCYKSNKNVAHAQHFTKKMLFMRNVFLQTYVLRTLPSSISLSSIFPSFPLYKKNHDPIAEIVIVVNVDQNPLINPNKNTRLPLFCDDISQVIIVAHHIVGDRTVGYGSEVATCTFNL